MAKEKSILEVLGSECSDKSIRAQAIFDVLKTGASDDEQAELFAVALSRIGDAPKNEKKLKNQGIAQEEWDTLTTTHQNLIDEHLKISFFKSKTALNFAKNILKLLVIFDNEDIKVYTIAQALYSNYVPFMELPGELIDMDDHQVNHIISSNESKSDLIRYINKIPFQSDVQQASMLLQVIDDTKVKEVRIALVGFFLNLYKRRLADAVKDKL